MKAIDDPEDFLVFVLEQLPTQLIGETCDEHGEPLLTCAKCIAEDEMAIAEESLGYHGHA